ncbi:unnamed protein product, partial [Rotaria sp. Silwood2]
CANNVPISTSGFGSANTNLTCVVDCSTDGNYSSTPIDILTDCTSASSSLKMMTSERSKNITLSADAHFYLAYRGNAWAPLNYPAQQGLDWSIVTYIDLRKRPDGFINTPPAAKFVSPQYAIVNKTIQINILVSDVNTGDDVRCRWSTYTTGYRRRKRSNDEDRTIRKYSGGNYKRLVGYSEGFHTRWKKFFFSNPCDSRCAYNCPCSNPTCAGTNCGSSNCPILDLFGGCNVTTTTSITTIETQATLKSTVSYPNRQSIDECGDICYPNNIPSSTSLSNCTISFTGLTAGIWYAVSIQVEDFINETSMTPMSSVPVQLLIYVMPDPSCSTKPIIIPLDRCLEVQVGISLSFNLYAMNLCDPNVAILTDMVVSSSITGMTNGNLINSPTNTSLSYVTFTWTPKANQVGQQKICTIAYTDEQVQSEQYCVTFTVKNSSDTCVTTTTFTSTTSSTTTTLTTTTSITTSSTTTTSTITTSTTTTSATTTSTATTSTTTTSTTTSSTTTTTTVTISTTTTTATTSTATSRSQIFTDQSLNHLPLVLGLGLGLGLPLLLVLSILSTCLCCRCCPGLFWRKWRQMIWGDEHVYCEVCGRQCNGHSYNNNSKMFDDDPGNYRRQYINDTSPTPTADSFYEHSSLSRSFSPFDVPSQTTTWTRFMSSSSVNVMPGEDIPTQAVRSAQLHLLEPGGSILVRAYVTQEQTKDNFSD